MIRWQAKVRSIPFNRLVVLARAYGMGPAESESLVDAIVQTGDVGEAIVQRHLDREHEGFVAMVHQQASGTYTRRAGWLRENKERLVQALRALL